MARPIRSKPDELGEDFMTPEYMAKFSRRDKAKRKFVMQYRRKLKLKYSIKEQIIEEYENFQDLKEGTAELRKMDYSQLVEELNKDMKMIE